MFACVKAVADEVPAGEAMFFRSFFAIPVLLAWLVYRGEFPHKLVAVDPMGHVWRGMMGSFAMGLGFLAVGLLPLPEAVAIGYTAPFMVTILAAMFLGERIRLVRFASLLLGLFGVFLVVFPTFSNTELTAATRLQTIGVFAALMAAMFSALAQVFARKLVATESTGAIVFYFSCMSSLLSLMTLPFGWVVPSLPALALLLTGGLLGGIGQILLTESYRHAEVAVIAPFEYSSILLAMLIGYFVFSEVPTPLMLLGVALIVTAGVIIILRERRLGIARIPKAKGAVPNQS
ncbi:Riboflavin transporter [Granulosicoccus antarcticus IMCC3135]|uniref:Riboflavin transporter n=2 Tax=Granulosicoccus TaxID=437504 RepID=A0A2Z2NJC8_9GAMM|nr:Riboflavin transporter [Granulosicoccus antarcticus IMCC3135]